MARRSVTPADRLPELISARLAAALREKLRFGGVENL
jgi:hypothetical protein